MVKRNGRIKIRPVGVVRNDFEQEVPEDYDRHPSDLVMSPEFSEALHLIEQNSHILVLFWLDRVDERGRMTLKLHPKGREYLPLVGVFATRSPHRPNPIGIRAVKLVKKNDNVLTVMGLDALDQSPVIDVKPYSLKHDLVKDASAPPWAKHLHHEGE